MQARSPDIVPAVAGGGGIAREVAEVAGHASGRAHAVRVSDPAKGVVGPNAVIQLRAALATRCGPAAAEAIMTAAGLAHYLTAPPEALVPEAEPARLFSTVCAMLPPDEAGPALGLAGRLTADYILAHRIPRAAQRLLRILPAPLAVRALLAAIRAHAWTFAGSGRVSIALGPQPRLDITANPLQTPGCPWHTSVLRQLFRETGAPAADVTHRRDGDTDRFEIHPTGLRAA